jgi:hypothetical protein
MHKSMCKNLNLKNRENISSQKPHHSDSTTESKINEFVELLEDNTEVYY